MFSKVRMGGHPVHPILIVYPIAFYTATPLAFLAYAYTQDLFWFRAGIALNLAGVATALLAAVPGFLDWLLAVPRGHRAKKVGLIHMISNVTALALFAVNAWLVWPLWNETFPETRLPLALTVTGLAITMFAGFLGGKLVYDHHVGVNLTPEQERAEREPSTRSAA